MIQNPVNRKSIIAERKIREEIDDAPRVMQSMALQRMMHARLPARQSTPNDGNTGHGSVATMQRNTAGSVVQLLPQAVTDRLKGEEQNRPAISGVNFIVHAVSDWLSENHIPHRLGGSLAALLQGGGRIPQDIDVEVESATIAQAALGVMANLNGRQFTYENLSATIFVQLVQTLPQLGGVARVRLSDARGEQREIDVDIVNENHNLNPHLIRPNERGVQAGDGNLVGAPELLVNYLNRSLQRPDYSVAKQDPQQIITLLRSAGFDPRNGDHVNALRRGIQNLVRPEALPQFLARLEEIITWALRQQ